MAPAVAGHGVAVAAGLPREASFLLRMAALREADDSSAMRAAHMGAASAAVASAATASAATASAAAAALPRAQAATSPLQRGRGVGVGVRSRAARTASGNFPLPCLVLNRLAEQLLEDGAGL